MFTSTLAHTPTHTHYAYPYLYIWLAYYWYTYFHFYCSLVVLRICVWYIHSVIVYSLAHIMVLVLFRITASCNANWWTTHTMFFHTIDNWWHNIDYGWCLRRRRRLCWWWRRLWFMMVMARLLVIVVIDCWR